MHPTPTPHPPTPWQVLFQGGRFQWDRLENLLRLAKEGTGSGPAGGGLDLSATVSDGARVRGGGCWGRPVSDGVRVGGPRAGLSATARGWG